MEPQKQQHATPDRPEAIPAPPSSEHFTVLGQQDGQYHTMAFPILYQWARDGVITAGHRVYAHEERTWMYAEEVPGIQSVFHRVRPRDERTPREVSVADIHMPFWSMVVFMLKWAIAAIPAIILLSLLAGIIWTIWTIVIAA